jgi:1,4-alpha-glucan branching enzyme
MWGEYDVKFQQVRTLYTYMYTHPGKKLSFMGNELGHFREWDEKKECDWFLIQYPKHDAFRKFLRELYTLYKNEPAFSQNDYNQEGFRWLEVDAVEERVYIYERIAGDDRFIVLLNMSEEQYNGYVFGYDRNAVLHEVLSSERQEYDGYFDGPRDDVKAVRQGFKWWKYSFSVTLPALAGIIYKVELLEEEKVDKARFIDEKSLERARKVKSSKRNKK